LAAPWAQALKAMKQVGNPVLLIVTGSLLGSVAAVAFVWPFTNLMQGELRCEGRGAVIIKIAGKDYAVNAMASPRRPPIRAIWNTASYPETNIDRLIVKGLTLCDW
jgi:hypothetical protein